jgi:Activator of Hsp90 ATPase homolog 1-like protein
MTTLPPLERNILVSWSPEAAFRRFTDQFGTWWPHRTHSVGGSKVQRVVFESGVGGRIFEEHVDGRRFQWGTVLEWNPPRLVRFTWHPAAAAADDAQQVTIEFVAEGGGTRLMMTHTGWDRLGAKGVRMRRGYNLGWRYVLDVWSGRRTGFIRLMDGLTAIMSLPRRFRRVATNPRDEAGGELPAGS